MGRVLRILSAAALFVLLAPGCGGGTGPRRVASQGVPRPLAQTWEGQASAIAAAASAGESCRALKLAKALHADVVASKNKVPARLRPPLLTGVTALADRIRCTPPAPTGPKEPAKPPHKEHDHHKEHGQHGHGKGKGGGEER